MKRRFPTSAELILLSALRQMPATAAELGDHVNGVSARGMHSLLGRMRSHRFVDVVAEMTDCPGKARPIYAITAAGKACADLADELRIGEEL